MNKKYFKLILDLSYIRKVDNESITDGGVIRGIAEHVFKNPEDKELLDKIDPRFQYAGLYPTIMRAYQYLNCMQCSRVFVGEEPQMCCSGRDCGCMGMPTEPIVCSKTCYENLMNKHK